jgi:hypothetical protein
MLFSKKLPHITKTTFEMRENTFEIFQNISNIILALCGALIFKSLERLRKCLFTRGPSDVADVRRKLIISALSA